MDSEKPERRACWKGLRKIIEDAENWGKEELIEKNGKGEMEGLS